MTNESARTPRRVEIVNPFCHPSKAEKNEEFTVPDMTLEEAPHRDGPPRRPSRRRGRPAATAPRCRSRPPGAFGQGPVDARDPALVALLQRFGRPWRWPAFCVFRAAIRRISAHFDALTSSERPD